MVRTLSIALAGSLLLPALSWGGVSSSGAQAIGYLSQQAERAGRSTTSAAQFRESVLDAYRFYHTYICYYGAASLSDSLLGSWEFADRIENLRPYWSPVQWDAIEKWKRLAREARKRTGVVYEVPRPEITWLDALARGEVIELDDTGGAMHALLTAVASTGWRIAIQHTHGYFEHSWEADGHVWVSEKRETEGVLRKGKKGPVEFLSILLEDYVVRSGRGKAVKERASDQSPVRAVMYSTKMKVRLVEPPKNARRQLLAKLDAAGFPMAKLQDAAPRELGVKPAGECRDRVARP